MAHKGEARSYFIHMLANGDRRSGCWEWPYFRNVHGYGVLNSRGLPSQLVHRSAFLVINGFDSLVCRHACDNRGCFNPAHLLDGTNADNVRDRMERSPRHNRGMNNPNSKLTDRTVREMRLLAAGGTSHRALARRFGISTATARKALIGETWTHVKELAS
jgi:hypothetical protein